jgi:glycosyltransferase involved in cell wall biosynthesis
VLRRLVTTFVPISRFCHERLREAGVPETKLALIRNALSRRAARDRSEREIVGLMSLRPTILAVGQIAPFKGTHLVIEATLELLARGEEVQTVILGALPEWPPILVEYADELRARVARAGADDRVHFVGLHEDVLAIMRAAYVLAAPILQEETFGNVLLEAKHAGLPAVTFARGGLTEQIRHGQTGYLCRTHDVAGLLEGLTYFLAQPAERARISAESLVEVERTDSDYQPAEFARRWRLLFDQRTRVAS